VAATTVGFDRGQFPSSLIYASRCVISFGSKVGRMVWPCADRIGVALAISLPDQIDFDGSRVRARNISVGERVYE